jgi:hypothetical protein
LAVSAQLRRSDRSCSHQPITDTLDVPLVSTMRSASPRRSRTVSYQPGGTSSRLIIAWAAIGAPSSVVAAGKTLGVASCPAARSAS